MAPGESRRGDLAVPVEELFSMARHAKFPQLKDALDVLPSKPFDKSCVQARYVAGHGTLYTEAYQRLPFHVNKSDEHGNSLLSLACQNGNLKLAKFLCSKGANPNHQNKNGQTPGHFAVAYQFFDLSHWLFANGADDQIENKYGLTPYDGLAPEGTVED
jgi:ankyrin repeat protein